MGQVSQAWRGKCLAGVFIVFSYDAKRVSCPQHACYVYLLIWLKSTRSYSIGIIILYGRVGAFYDVNFRQSLILYAQDSTGPFCGSWHQMHMKTMCHPRKERTISPDTGILGMFMILIALSNHHSPHIEKKKCSLIIRNMDSKEF